LVTDVDNDAAGKQPEVNIEQIKKQLEQVTTLEQLNALYKKLSNSAKGNTDVLKAFKAKKETL
jgi:hypothetical protein